MGELESWQMAMLALAVVVAAGSIAFLLWRHLRAGWKDGHTLPESVRRAQLAQEITEQQERFGHALFFELRRACDSHARVEKVIDKAGVYEISVLVKRAKGAGLAAQIELELVELEKGQIRLTLFPEQKTRTFAIGEGKKVAGEVKNRIVV